MLPQVSSGDHEQRPQLRRSFEESNSQPSIDVTAHLPHENLYRPVSPHSTKKVTRLSDSDDTTSIRHGAARICLTPPLTRSGEVKLTFWPEAKKSPEEAFKKLAPKELPHYQQLWKTLELVSPNFSEFAPSSILTSPESKDPYAKGRCRYLNTLPRTLGLVTLKNKTNPDTDFINANIFEHNMIITQGPLHGTVADFWVMIFERADHIVCLTEHQAWNKEKKRFDEKTAPYWNPSLSYPGLDAPKAGDIIFSEVLGPMHSRFILKVKLIDAPVVVVESNPLQVESVTKQTMEISLGEEKKIVTHWFLKEWPDFSVCSVSVLVQMFQIMVHSADGLSAIHCSAGIGRSGVFAIIKKFIDIHKKTGKIPEEAEVLCAIRELRERRPSSVMNVEQLALIFKTLYFYFKPSFPDQ